VLTGSSTHKNMDIHTRNLSQSVFALVDELVRGGVTNFVVCPGSRSTPLALIIARHNGAKTWMQLDERSAGFFALGLAKASGKPVALVCTSGTAAANFLPAVIEAYQGRVPLIVLTADRPPELRESGAPQTIDQVGLYGSHVRWFVDMALPDAAPALLRYVRTVAGRAIGAAMGAPRGPVHINCPFREPLLPAREVPADDTARDKQRPFVAVQHGSGQLDRVALEGLVQRLTSVQRGLLVVGPQDDPQLAPTVAKLSCALNWPLLADPLSQVRYGNTAGELLIDAYDAFLRDEAFAAQHSPQVVLRFGAMPTAKPWLLYLQRHPACEQIIVDSGPGWQEPTLSAATMIYAEPVELCEQLCGALKTENGAQRTEHSRAEADAKGSSQFSILGYDWTTAWTRANQCTRAVIAHYFADTNELSEGQVFAELGELLPAGAALYLGNSMPVRDADTFLTGRAAALRVYGNRGANGIDGVVSSALGAVAGGATPLVLVIGDVSFYHDMNGLLAAKQYSLNATIVLINNDGGGIFSFLPQASERDQFELLFGTPHGLDFRPVGELYGASYSLVEDWPAFRAAVRAGVAGRGLHLVELRTVRERNVSQHRAIWPLVSAALSK
jgi:2-succinyl-5-enolpyruvyl-6-hydroxy-3-cyclohexene-1-carboxylate synthase